MQKSNPEKQFPSIEAPYAGWTMVKDDPVQYKDAQRRSLTFLFGLTRDVENTVMYSPINKNVAVYQKNEEGDFVIVTRSGNNPNDIRVMDVTNEYYGDPDPDPNLLIKKVIEMADGTGMTRDIAEYAEYGKTGCFVETAGAFEDGFNQAMGIKPQKNTENNASPITTQGSPLAQKIAQSTIGAVGNVAKDIMSTSAGANTVTRKPSGFWKAISNPFMSKKGKTPADQANLENLKHQHKMEQMGAKAGADITHTSIKQTGAGVLNEATLRSKENIAKMQTDVAKQGIQSKERTAKYTVDTRVGALRPDQTKRVLTHSEAILRGSSERRDSIIKAQNQRTAPVAAPANKPVVASYGSSTGIQTPNPIATPKGGAGASFSVGSQPVVGTKPAQSMGRPKKNPGAVKTPNQQRQTQSAKTWKGPGF